MELCLNEDEIKKPQALLINTSLRSTECNYSVQEFPPSLAKAINFENPYIKLINF